MLESETKEWFKCVGHLKNTSTLDYVQTLYFIMWSLHASTCFGSKNQHFGYLDCIYIYIYIYISYYHYRQISAATKRRVLELKSGQGMTRNFLLSLSLDLNSHQATSVRTKIGPWHGTKFLIIIIASSQQPPSDERQN